MRIRLSFIALLLSILPAVAWGQGLVDGTVVNGNKFAGAPGKTVHLVNNTMKPPVDRTAVTDDDGYYRFANVAPGDGYSVEVLSDTGKPLGVDQALHFSVGNEKHTAVPDIDIAKGVTANEASKVTGLIVNDRTTAPGANVSNEQLQDLPLYNRTFLALGSIQPGVHDVEQGSPLQGAGFSIAGSRAGSTDFRLNSLSSPESTGVDNVASSNNQAIPFQVNEAVQDFRVIYATPDLRYGQGSGGVIDVVTSQGRLSATSAWHGSAFGYFDNDALNASTPLSVYSNSGFVKAQAYANDAPTASTMPFTINSQTFPGNDIVFTGSNPYLGYSPQSYNDLQSLVSALDTSNSTSMRQAGQFQPSNILSSQNSHTFPVTQAQFGASAGGPLFSGKLLLFASYEGTYINNPTPIFERVPTFLDRTGNLPSGLNAADSDVAQGVLNLFPAPNVGQTGSALATGGNSGIFGFYRGTAPNYTHVHNVHIRPDIPLGARGTLSMRYTGQLIDQLHDDTLPASSVYPGNGADRKAQNQSAAITHNLPFRKNVNVVNIGFTQFRVDEVAQDRNFSAKSVGGGSAANSLSSGALSTFVISGIDTRTTGAAPGIPGYMGGWSDSFWQTSPNPQFSPSPITPSLDGDFPLARIGAPLSAPSAHRDTEAFAYDTLSLRLGDRNQLALGGDYRYQQNYSYDGGLARGLVISNNIGEFTSDSETCISCGTAFSKPSFDYELRQPSPYVGDLRSSSFGAFAEDTFQPSERVTLSFGVRYDYFGEPLDTQGRLWNFSQADQGLVEQATSGTFDAFDYQCKGASTQTAIDSFYGAKRPSFSSGWNCTQNGSFFLPQNKHDLTGRLGMSFSPDKSNKTVMRAAVGGYYDHLPASYNEQLLKNRPSAFNVANPSAIYGQNFDSTGCGTFPAQCGFGNPTLNVTNEPNDPNYANFQNYQAASGANILYERDPSNLQTPYSIQFSAGIQRQITNAWTMEIGFVGSASHRLPLIYDGNFTNEFYCTQGGGTPTAPGGLCNNNTFFPVFTESHFGASNYNSGIVRVSSQQWHGLSLHGAYTYARSMDDIAGGQFPQSTDAIWSQLFARQLYGMGNPVSFALGAGSSSGGGTGRPAALFSAVAASCFPGATVGACNRAALASSANIPSFNAISSALTTTGSRPITVSHYNITQSPLAFSSRQVGYGGDYGPSDFDVTSRAVADFVYRLPDFGSRWTNGFLVSGIFTAQSGQPFSIFSGPAYGQVAQRISVGIAQTSPIHTTGKPTGYFSGISPGNLAPSASSPTCPNLYAKGTVLYTGTAPGLPEACVGNSARNSFRGPSYINQDFAIQKTTRVYGESQNVIVRAEFFNLFNRANYYNPISEYSLDGVHVNPEFGLVRSAHDPLQIQFAVRYAF